MAKVQKLKFKKAEKTEIEDGIPADLNAQVQSMRAFADTHNLLGMGHFPVNLFQSVHQSIQFMRTLHEKAASVALAHPKADLIPELKAVKEQEAMKAKAKEEKAEAADGTT